MPYSFAARLSLPQYLAVQQEKVNSENIFPAIPHTPKETVKYTTEGETKKQKEEKSGQRVQGL